MNATIGIYDDHDRAVEATLKLKEAGFPVSKLSIIGKAMTEEIDEEMHVTQKSPLKIAGLGAGTLLGTTLGILTGVGIFAIPGVGFLYGAGALVGAIAGFDLGLIGGGLASVLTTIGVTDENTKRYNDAINNGKFVVVAQGTKEELQQAHDIMHAHGTHYDITQH